MDNDWTAVDGNHNKLEQHVCPRLLTCFCLFVCFCFLFFCFLLVIVKLLFDYSAVRVEIKLGLFFNLFFSLFAF